MHTNFPPGLGPGVRHARELGAAWLAALILFVVTGVASAEPAGVFVWTSGPVDALARDGTTRTIVRGDPVLEGDTVRTGTNGLAQVRLVDGGILSIRSETEWRLDRFQNVDAPGGSAIVIALVRGGLRSVTGMIGRVNPAAYLVITPTAWIGVRGTDHEPFVVPADDPRHPPGTYDRVHEGRIVMRAIVGGAPGGEIELTAGQTAYVGIGASAPTPLDAIPRFYVPPPSLPPAGRSGAAGEWIPPADAVTRKAAPMVGTPPSPEVVAPAPEHLPGPAVATTPNVAILPVLGPPRSALAFPELPRLASPPAP